MHIKKQNPLDTISTIQRRDNEQLVEQEKIPFNRKLSGKTEHREKYENTGIDRVRNQVFTLHNEVKDIQTRISGKQIQVSFLENLKSDENWKSKLEAFMKENSPDTIFIKPDPDLKTYVSKLNAEIKILNNDMFTREVKLENIISSGIMDSGIDIEKADGSSIFVRDMNKAREVFSKIKSDSINRILKS